MSRFLNKEKSFDKNHVCREKNHKFGSKDTKVWWKFKRSFEIWNFSQLFKTGFVLEKCWNVNSTINTQKIVMFAHFLLNYTNILIFFSNLRINQVIKVTYLSNRLKLYICTSLHEFLEGTKNAFEVKIKIIRNRLVIVFA